MNNAGCIDETTTAKVPYGPAAWRAAQGSIPDPTAGRARLQHHDKRSTILVVDDTPENIATLAAVLNGEYRTKAATDGEKALELARSDPGVDLILLDVVMPGMDGVQTLAALRRLPALAEVPVAFLTGSNRAVDGDRYLELGAIGAIGKPLNPRTLASAVLTVWEQRPYWQACQTR